jgi:hypothetical protein
MQRAEQYSIGDPDAEQNNDFAGSRDNGDERRSDQGEFGKNDRSRTETSVAKTIAAMILGRASFATDARLMRVAAIA